MDSSYSSVGYEGHFSEDEEDSDEAIDPRVKGELERLNNSTVEINRLEQELQEVQAAFRQILTESAYVLKTQANHLGKCVEQARPYYKALDDLREAQIETQKAAIRFENACNAHRKAKEMVAFAEQRLFSSSSSDHCVLDPALQEMLNHATIRFMESEQERCRSEQDHLQIAQRFTKTEREMAEHKNKLKSAITKSRTYFELRSKYKLVLEGHKRKVDELQHHLTKAKKAYSLSLKNLEDISEEIHEMRRSRDSLDILLDKREQGVGAETPHDQGLCCGASVNTSFSEQQTYGFQIALVTRKPDESKFSGGGINSGFESGTKKQDSAITEEQSRNLKGQKVSLTRVLVSTSSDNGNVVQITESKRNLVGMHQGDGRESRLENITKIKPSTQYEETMSYGSGSQFRDPSNRKEQHDPELFGDDKVRNNLSKNAENPQGSEAAIHQTKNLEFLDSPAVFGKASKDGNNVSDKMESGLTNSAQQEHEQEEVVCSVQQTVYSVTAGDSGTGENLMKTKPGLQLDYVSEDESKIEEHENRVRRQSAGSKTVDNPETGYKSGELLTKVEMEPDFASEDESKKEEHENCVGLQNAGNKTVDDSETGCKSSERLPKVEVEVDFVSEDESKIEEHENRVGLQSAGCKTVDNPETAYKSSEILSEVEMEPDFVSEDESKKEEHENGVGLQSAGSKTVDDVETGCKSSELLPKVEVEVDFVSEDKNKIGDHENRVGLQSAGSKTVDNPETAYKSSELLPKVEVEVDFVSEDKNKIEDHENRVGLQSAGSKTVDYPETGCKSSELLPKVEMEPDFVADDESKIAEHEICLVQHSVDIKTSDDS